MINNFKFCLKTNDEKLQYPIIEHHACNAYKITRNIINIFKILFTKYLYKRRQLKISHLQISETKQYVNDNDFLHIR